MLPSFLVGELVVCVCVCVCVHKVVAFTATSISVSGCCFGCTTVPHTFQYGVLRPVVPPRNAAFWLSSTEMTPHAADPEQCPLQPDGIYTVHTWVHTAAYALPTPVCCPTSHAADSCFCNLCQLQGCQQNTPNQWLWIRWFACCELDAIRLLGCLLATALHCTAA
jgi:hypothetical protein